MSPNTSLVVDHRNSPCEVYIGRSPIPEQCHSLKQKPTPYGNPFIIEDTEDEVERAEVIRKHEIWLLDPSEERRALVKKVKEELKGKVLGCWCAPRKCHGDTLSRVAGESEEATEKRRAELGLV